MRSSQEAFLSLSKEKVCEYGVRASQAHCYTMAVELTEVACLPSLLCILQSRLVNNEQARINQDGTAKLASIERVSDGVLHL